MTRHPHEDVSANLSVKQITQETGMFRSTFLTLPPLGEPGGFWRSSAFVILVALALTSTVCAQDHTVVFNTADPGVNRGITNWGLDTGWPNFDNMQRGLIFMGTNTVNLVQVAFEMNAPLTNNDISPSQKADLTNMVTLASMTSTGARWIMSSGTGAGVDSSYQSGTGTVYPNLWAAAMAVWQRNYALQFPNRTMWMAQGFNEPDYGWGQGSQQNLYDILGYLQASTNFAGVRLGGGCTLDCGAASPWYDYIASRVSVGTTHCINGSVSSYVGFIQSVLMNNAMPFDSEIHNLGEVIIGANYGIQGGTWWGTAELARGDFAKACQGKLLGYADDWANWTAAAVYRATNGAVQAFLGGSERHGVQTSYRFFSKDRDVFYNGNGPRRDYTATNPGYAEQVVNITWGADVPPIINGRYIVVNHNSGKVMEVAGASTNDGANIQQNTYNNGLNQQWDIVPYSSAGGDVSFYGMTAAHSRKAADVYNFSYADGANVQQWTNYPGLNQQWFFEYVSNGWFYIRSRWSGKYLDVYGLSTANGGNIDQWTGNNGLNQQWRLIPVVSAFDFVAPAAPTGVTATANAVSVQLNWAMNSESDLASYTVLRATNLGGPYEICARGLTNNAFTDKSANQNRRFYYLVQAVDRSLNISGNSPPVSAIPTCGPAIVAHYTFDGNTSDSSGNANNPIILDGLPALVAGKYGSALGLNGANQDVMLPAGMMAGVTNFTFAAWVYWNSGAVWQRIFDFGNDTTQYMFLTPASGSGTLRFAITTNGGGAEQIVETAPLTTNQWIHVAVTCNGTTGCLYTNGALAASGSISLNPAVFNPALNYLGESQYSADPLFNGALDEVLVANYAMNAAQIAWLPFNSAPLPALVHRYSFNETGGTEVNDSIGGAPWNGALPNGGTFSGGQLTLSSATSQYVNLPAGILSNYTAVTIEAWATFPYQIPWNTMFFSFGNTYGSDGINYIFCAPQSGRIAITSTNYTGEQNAYSGIDFSFHTNLHVTAIFNPPANYLAIYTNGVLAGVNTAITTPMNAVSNVFSYIGRSLYTGDAYFNFSLDEFRIYNGVMQPVDIAASQLAGPNVLLTTNVLLNTSNNGGQLTLHWPVAGPGFKLVSSPALGSGAAWTPVSVTPNIVGANYQLTVTPTNGTLFFRLQR
jgi:hypothetical protein